MAATESLAAVDTICVDKTGTLTTGELELVGIEVADADQAEVAKKALGRFAASSGRAQPDARGGRGDTSRPSGEARPSRGPLLLRVEVERPNANGKRGGETYVLGAPDVLAARGAMELPPGPAAEAHGAHTAGRRVVAFGRAGGRAARRPRTREAAAPRSTPLALIVLEETLRPDAAETIEFMREQQMDLKLISGDARETVTAVATAVGVPADAGVVEGDELRRRPRGAGARPPRRTRSSAGSGPSRRRRSSRRSPTAAGTRR